MRISRLAVIAFLPLSFAGCSVPVNTGRRPHTHLLESTLKVDNSRRGHVLEVLGPPNGVGRAKLPMHTEPRVTWYYFSQLGGMQQVASSSLVVFFEGDVFAGYLWYSSEPQPVEFRPIRPRDVPSMVLGVVNEVLMLFFPFR